MADTSQPRSGGPQYSRSQMRGSHFSRTSGQSNNQAQYNNDPYAGSQYGDTQNPYAQGNTQRTSYYASDQEDALWSNTSYQTGYSAPSDNPYVSGPTSGAVGYNAERVKSNNASANRYRTGSAGYGVPGAPRKRKRRAPMGLIIAIVVAVVAGVGAWFFLAPPFYNVTINGVERFVRSGMTLQEALEENYATPTAGDLLAVDGTVYTEGGGEAFEATINGETTTDPNAAMPKDAVVEITDGKDVTEDYTETTQTLTHGTSGTDYTSSNAYWAGAIHVYSSGEDGEETVKTGNVSGIQVTEVTKEPVDEGYSVFSVNTNGDKVIALTFDDGPWGDTTDEILDILAENDAKATFFEIGNQCAEYPTQVKRIISEGHQIATHSYDHASGSGQGVNLTFMSATEQRNEIEKGFSAIEDVAGTSVSRVMRAPGGNYYGSIITNLKDLVKVEIGWDVDTEDWRKPGASTIAARIESAQPGNVILMHDGGGDRSQTAEGLRQALPVLKAQGYSFVTIDELLGTYTSIDLSSN